MPSFIPNQPPEMSGTAVAARAMLWLQAAFVGFSGVLAVISAALFSSNAGNDSAVISIQVLGHSLSGGSLLAYGLGTIVIALLVVVLGWRMAQPGMTTRVLVIVVSALLAIASLIGLLSSALISCGIAAVTVVLVLLPGYVAPPDDAEDDDDLEVSEDDNATAPRAVDEPWAGTAATAAGVPPQASVASADTAIVSDSDDTLDSSNPSSTASATGTMDTPVTPDTTGATDDTEATGASVPDPGHS